MSAASSHPSTGKLFIVAVPIGNLDDITLRALRVLKSVEQIVCEDTRRTGKLFERLGLVPPRLRSLHEHNETQRVPAIIARLQDGADVALVSDAGTPTISDPGYCLVRAAIEAEIVVVPVPGACAAIAALCASGLGTDRFRFVGFAPARKGPRRRLLAQLAEAGDTLVLYVSPHQIEGFLRDAAEILGADRRAVVARELTKRHEEFRRGTLAELAESPGTIRGEMVVVIERASAPSPAGPEAVEQALRDLLEGGYPPAKAAKEAARQTGVSRDEAYRCLLALKESDEQ